MGSSDKQSFVPTRPKREALVQRDRCRASECADIGGQCDDV